MAAQATIKQGSTPTVTIHVTRDLTAYRCIAVIDCAGLGQVVREVTPEAAETGCTIVVALTEAESMAMRPGSARVEVAALDPATKAVIKTETGTLGVENSIIDFSVVDRLG